MSKEAKQYAALGCNFIVDPCVIPYPEQLRMMKDAGFGAFFSGWDREQLPLLAETAAKLGYGTREYELIEV